MGGHVTVMGPRGGATAAGGANVVFARLKAGESLSVLPSPIHLTLGIRDVLVLTNDDEVIHQVGPIILGSRQTYRIPFRRPGHFQYACSLTDTLHLLIAPAPEAGLAPPLARSSAHRAPVAP
jgi:hypothetical protein